jgi:hypothetical protein
MATGPEALGLPQVPEYSGLETRSSLVSPWLGTFVISDTWIKSA